MPAGRPLPLVLIMERVHRQRSRLMTLTSFARRPSGDLGLPEGNHHACRGVHYSFLHPAKARVAVVLQHAASSWSPCCYNTLPPLIAPKIPTTRIASTRAKPIISRYLIGHRRAGGTSNRENGSATQAVVHGYNERIALRLKNRKRTARRHGALAPESELVGTRLPPDLLERARKWISRRIGYR